MASDYADAFAERRGWERPGREMATPSPEPVRRLTGQAGPPSEPDVDQVQLGLPKRWAKRRRGAYDQACSGKQRSDAGLHCKEYKDIPTWRCRMAVGVHRPAAVEGSA